jgi:hypothetical protein
VAQDTTLSRWRHGFKSRWDYEPEQPVLRLVGLATTSWNPIVEPQTTDSAIVPG